MFNEEELEEIEDLIGWNMSFNISVYDTLKEIDRLDLYDLYKIHDTTEQTPLAIVNRANLKI